ncbi:hypothetical protein CCMA1212_000985, partial [Trichoderma ghanense]
PSSYCSKQDPRKSKLHLGHLLNRSREPFPSPYYSFEPAKLRRQPSLLHLSPTFSPTVRGWCLIARIVRGRVAFRKQSWH